MSSYDVAITLGGYAFTVSDTDPPIEETVTVLDDLRLSWANGSSDPRPAQPAPSSAQVRFMTRDVANLAALDIGTPAQIKVTSGGTMLAAIAGRVTDLEAVPSALANGDRVMTYTVTILDYVVDLAELLIDLVRPQEFAFDRITALVDAIAAAGGPPINYGSTLGGAVEFEAINEVQKPALDLLLDFLRQYTPGYVGIEPIRPRYLVVPCTTAGELDSFTLEWAATKTTLTRGPARWDVVGGLLSIVPDGTPPTPGGLANPQGGLLIDSCTVLLDGITWNRDKFGSVNTVSVRTSTFTVTASSPATTPVRLALSSTLTGVGPATAMADMYLPEVPELSRWSMEAFTWRPSDAELAGLPWPLVVDTDNIDPDGLSLSVLDIDLAKGPTAYYAQVVLSPIPDAINPASTLGFLGGTLTGATLRIRRGKVTIDAALDRRIPIADNIGGLPLNATVTEIGAEFPTIAAEDIDPAITAYDARLAHI